MSMEATKDNILWIDYAKFIGIFLVIIVHSGIECNIFDFIQLFFMPMFFIISGYLYKQKDFSQNISKIIWRLVIPYLIYQFMYLPLAVLKEIIYHGLQFCEVLPKCLLGILLGDTTAMYQFFIPVCGTCWFILSMIQVRFFMSFIRLNLFNIISISIGCIIILKLLVTNKINLLFCLDNTIMAIPFFLFGYLLQRTKSALIYVNKKRLNILAIILCFFILLLFYKYNQSFNMARVTTSLFETKSLTITYLGALIGSYMVMLFSSFFSKANDFVNTISKNTLFIIFFHWFILFFINWAGYFKLNILNSNILINICIVFVVSVLNLLINYYVIKFLEKRVPIILGKGLKNVTQ